MIMVTVMHGKFVKITATEFPATATAYMRVHLERPRTIVFLTLLTGLARFSDNTIEFAGFIVRHNESVKVSGS
jgi:hypothetical protein